MNMKILAAVAGVILVILVFIYFASTGSFTTTEAPAQSGHPSDNAARNLTIPQ